SRQQQNKWKRPPEGFVKCNYDGSFHNMTTAAQGGWIVHEQMGSFLGAGQIKTSKPHNALESELQALLVSMMNYNINVIKLVTRQTKNIDVLNWLRDIWRWEEKFNSVIHLWTNRGSNTCAGLLAKQEMTEQNSYTYHCCIPVVISSAITNDYFDH
ncbi:hypothetical protein N665_0218s0010, partial [Sinapis alba]